MFKSVRVENAFPLDLRLITVFSDSGLSVAESPEVQEAARRPEFKAEVGDIAEAFPANQPRVLLLGLGKKAECDRHKVIKAAAAAARRIAALRVESVQIELSQPAFAAAFGEAFGLLGWRFDAFRGSAAKPDQAVALALSSTDEAVSKGLAQGVALARSVNLARTLAETPPNVATPDYMAEKSFELEQFEGISVSVLKGEDLENERLTGLITVGKASENPPCLIRIEYCPTGKEGTPPVVLIGKTMCYDTGGLSIKPREGMAGMKIDKAGGCAVLGAMHALATVVKPEVRVVALLAAAENSISNNAYRPDDIITFRNGVTVEITNTDAEGRLVLADALCYAVDKENPAKIVDFATLTGGVVTALGKVYAGLFVNDDQLESGLRASGEATGERLWTLPLNDQYRDLMRSSVADILNSNPNRQAHPIQGAAFLSFFVPESIPHAHIDIAGTADADKPNGAFEAGATGFGVRLIADWLRP